MQPGTIMNKLIERMATQAHVLESDIDGLAGPYGGNSKELLVFCELIVRECIKSMSDSLTTQEQIDNIKVKFEIY